MEKDMITVLDNIFMPNQIEVFREALTPSMQDVCFFEYGATHDSSHMCNRILERAHNFIDLTDSIGYEYWTQQNTKPGGLHQDKDEKAFRKGITRFPMCSIVYYLTVENLEGGELVINNVTITPKENSMIVFSSGLEHEVKDFTGTRVSIAVNPWETKLYK